MCTGMEPAVLASIIGAGGKVASSAIDRGQGGGGGLMADEPSFTPLPGTGGAQQGFVDPNQGRMPPFLKAQLGLIPNLILELLMGGKGGRKTPQLPQIPNAPSTSPGILF